MNNTRLSTGIASLDSILEGGLISQRSYLIKGGAGTGKSTIGYHFLEAGNQAGEASLLITLGETEKNIRAHSSAMGIDLSDTTILDLGPGNQSMKSEKNYSVFSPLEVEAEPLINNVIETINKHQPTRVMLDSLTMVKYLYENPFQYKNMAMSLIHQICSTGATLVMISEKNEGTGGDDSEFWVDGVMEVKTGPEWRRINVQKYRGSGFREGDHAMKITGEGIVIFPRLQPNKYSRAFQNNIFSSGIDELDKMLNGGIEKGTISMFTGPTGAGKTNLGIQFMKQAALRGDRSVIYTFEEPADVIINRSRMIGVPVDDMLESGKLEIKSIEPFSFSPDEFAVMVREDVAQNNTRMVMIDSVGGYGLTVRHEDALQRIHSLCTYLGNVGVTTFLITETQSVTGEFITTNLNASYLADNIIYLRYIELNGELKKSIGILKKRLSNFEKSIRELKITSEGIQVGKPLSNVRGILSGSAQIVDPNT